MQPKIENKNIEEIRDLRKADMLKPNLEYQRGEVWSKSQKQKLIDSVLRGYPIPLMYLHDEQVQVRGRRVDSYHVIDGQQRINALYEFSEGAFKLLDPAKKEDGKYFPKFLASRSCPWGGLEFRQLSNDLKEKFLDTPISVAIIKCDEDEARDLFIRLQAGAPLNAQEKRDALAGKVTELVLKIGGKPQLARYPGNDFFTRVMRMKPSRDRGATRQLATQLLMLYLTRREGSGKIQFSDIKSQSLDNFYYQNLDMDIESEDIQRFEKILDKMSELFGDGKRRQLKGHDAIHLVLLLEVLWDNFVPTWQGQIASAYDEFAKGIVKARGVKVLTGNESENDKDFWNYYQQTRSRSDQASTIDARHKIYVRQMSRFLGEFLIPKDPKRLFSPDEKELIYYRDEKKCHFCKREVPWVEAEIHHVLPHSEGGKTILENGVLVCQKCHPRGSQPSG